MSSSPVDRYFADAAVPMHRSLGSETITVRRRHDLRDSGRRGTPALRLANAAGMGETTLEVEAVAGGLVGEIPAGAVITLGGEQYASALEAQASGGELSVTLTTPLVASANAGDPVQITEAIFTLTAVLVFALQQLPGEPATTSQDLFGISVPARHGVRLQRGDHVSLADGRSGDVLGAPNEDAGAFDYYIGSDSLRATGAA